MALLIKNIGLLATPVGKGPRRGREQAEIRLSRDAAILCDEGLIKEITEGGLLPGGASDAGEVIDAGGRLVTPGLVDAHTHMVFGGWRQREIVMKLKGAGYLDILRAGGGIMDTVRCTRAASYDALLAKTRGFLDQMLALGVTTAEAKSGYGLDLSQELKILRVIRELDRSHALDLVPTFLGPHAVPAEYAGRADEYIELCTGEMLTAVKTEGLAEFADIFIEDEVFDAAQGRTYLSRAKELGFGLKVHADEIVPIGGARLAGELGAVSAEHLIVISEQGMEALAEGGTVACCLPGTSFYLGAAYAPARRMIDYGIPVACASDFNPGSCPSFNMQFIMHLACLRYGLVPEEVLTALTLNAAAALGRAGVTGSLEEDKAADIVIWDAPDPAMLCYRFGSNLAARVIKKGKIVK